MEQPAAEEHQQEDILAAGTRAQHVLKDLSLVSVQELADQMNNAIASSAVRCAIPVRQKNIVQIIIFLIAAVFVDGAERLVRISIRN